MALAAKTRKPPTLYVGFEQYSFFIEWYGGYEPNAQWIGPFWLRLRSNLGATDASSGEGWEQGGGIKGNRWTMPLEGDHLKEPLTRRQALDAVKAVVNEYNLFPHNKGIKLVIM